MALSRTKMLLLGSILVVVLVADIGEGASKGGVKGGGGASIPPFGIVWQQLCEDPPPPLNGRISCESAKKDYNRYVCRAKCNPGYFFPDGETRRRHVCGRIEGTWVPEFKFPDCQAVCDPPCENGGECKGDHCICTPQYRGRSCQFPTSLCDPSKTLEISGMWSCNHTSDITSCVVNCPPGTVFDTNPSDIYFCSLNGTWSPLPAPKCIPVNIIKPLERHELFPMDIATVQPLSTHSSDICATWGQFHYRTFDGYMYSFRGPCTYLLAKDCSENTFSIHVRNDIGCEGGSICRRTITLFVGEEKYIFFDTGSGPSVYKDSERIKVPGRVNGLIFFKIASYIEVTSSLGFRLKWNGEETILLSVSDSLKNKTCGLCGRYDGSSLNDLEIIDGTLADTVSSFAESWKMSALGELCDKTADENHPCNYYSSVLKGTISEAESVCQILLSSKFAPCHYIVDPKPYIENCKMDYCACTEFQNKCICNTLAEYFRECVRLGGKIQNGWRSSELCPLECPFGMVYEDCGTSCPKTCKGTLYDCEGEHCVDGCHCPDGTFLHGNQCLYPEDCPCIHRDQEYSPGERVDQDCNSCECQKGQWECTAQKCEARCSSVGDSHFTTFDGIKYEFLGSCSYYLVYHDSMSIIQDNVNCGSLEKSMKDRENAASCTKYVIIHFGERILRLNGFQVTLNDKEVIQLPLSTPGILVYMASSLFVKVELANGLSLMWDGTSRLYIDAPYSLMDQTKGLCGTFSYSQKDEFLTPDGDIETDVYTFAEQWKTTKSCEKQARQIQEQPCEMYPQKELEAQKFCSVLKSEVFEVCHGEVDPEPFYRDCLIDLCSCQKKLDECLCPIFADYGATCAKRGQLIEWRPQVPSCRLSCTGGQVYQECSDSCMSTCLNIASNINCKKKCVEGCACPQGTALNTDGLCIPISQCPCSFEEKEYPSGGLLPQGNDVCMCLNAVWECGISTLHEHQHLNHTHEAYDQPAQCTKESNMVYVSCLPECPETCENMHLSQRCKTTSCRGGCRCIAGYVLNIETGHCVKPAECGCRHAGKKYEEGQAIQRDCNLCVCDEGSWKCNANECAGICTTWGESHFKTFDGRIYDFQGDCEFVLAKGKLDEKNRFSITIQNVPCGTSGITCSKSFTVDLGGNKLTFAKDKPLPETRYSSSFAVRVTGLFVFIYTDIGVSIQWDKGTRIYVEVQPKWKGRVVGLCGDFNDDQNDDFRTSSKGLIEALPTSFANNWRILENCPPTEATKDTCLIHPSRKSWALKRCAVLKSEIFKPCHLEVPLSPYYERCVFDACACDTGGDCECLCTAIAAYAQECNINGIALEWRTQDLCPIQCGECSTYKGCISSCPKKTCESQFFSTNATNTCYQQPCIEGCEPKPCPDGQIYDNDKDYNCIPEAECIIPCKEINGYLYMEGERILDFGVVDRCLSCHCRRGSISCTGTPCSSTVTPTLPQTIQKCETGWTPWMNTPSIAGGDFELLLDPRLEKRYGVYCSLDRITKIECRVSWSKMPHKLTGQNVMCSVPKGLECIDSDQSSGMCDDYEIRIYCDCGPLITSTIFTTTPKPLEKVCHAPGWTFWMNSYSPDKAGDFETFEELRKVYSFCSENEIEKIECRNAISRESYEFSNGASAKCSKEVGLMCVNSGIGDGTCADYEVRFYCTCNETDCDYPRGMENGAIKSHQIKVSSYLSPATLGSMARLNGPGAWSAGEVHSEQWIQVDLEEIQEVTGIITQGNSIKPEWVTAYTVLYSEDGVEFTRIKNLEGTDRIFKGNHDQSSEVRHMFDYPVRAKFIKIVPYEWENWISLRMELLGCNRFPEVMPSSPKLPLYTQTYPSCIPGWTRYFNVDSPKVGSGDEETIQKILENGYELCPPELITDIECKTYLNGQLMNYNATGDFGAKCSLDTGFVCYNDLQLKGHSCHDYTVRFYCSCGTTLPPKTTTTPPPIGCTPGWTRFINYDSPYTNNGDFELLSELVEKDRFCNPSQVTNIECKAKKRVSSGKRKGGLSILTVDWKESGDRNVECSKEKGLLCFNDMQSKGRCNDYSVRFFCECRPMMQPNVTLPPTSIPTVTPLPQVCGWTPWLNSDIPRTHDNDTGDFETIESLQKLYHTCIKPELKMVECRISKTKFSWDTSEQNKLVCNIENGFRCYNKYQTNLCYDYEIRLFCLYDWCERTTVTQEITSASLYTTSTPKPVESTTLSVCPQGQVFDSCAFQCNQTCHSFLGFLQEKRECYLINNKCVSGCRPDIKCKFPYFWRDDLTCVKVDECTCVMHNGTIIPPNAVIEKNCQKCQCVNNSFFCQSIPKCSIETGEQGKTTITSTIPVLNEDCWTEWINSDSPDTDGGDFENLIEIQKIFEFCSHPVHIECRDSNTKKDATDAGQNVECNVRTGLQCWNSVNEGGCRDYEIRFFCPCPTSTTSLPTHTATGYTPAPCVDGWTEWFNAHSPDEKGETETVQNIRNSGGQFCSSNMITAINCSIAGNEMSSNFQSGVLCDLQVGLVCLNANVFPEGYCKDYKIRFYCDCPSTIPFITSTPFAPTSTLSTTVGVTPTSTLRTTARVRITTPFPTTKPCDYWSEWINEYTPLSFPDKDGGDYEYWTPEDLKEKLNFCVMGKVSKVECKDALQGKDYSETGDKELTCTLENGLICFGEDQPTNICKDYKIHYYCSCAKVTPTRSTAIPTVRPCFGYKYAINGPEPLPDSSLTASSSFSPISGPEQGRIITQKSTTSAGAWIPVAEDPHPYLEVDFGKLQSVYGVITKGRDGFQEWVAAYNLKYSRDGISYAYISDGPNYNIPKVFPGNFDSSTAVRHMFELPFEARFMRIIPLQWVGQVAIRMDFFICSRETSFTTVTYAPPTPSPVCNEKMGMENQEILDDQLSVSSSRNSHSGADRARLNTPQTHTGAGGWVAGILNGVQYFQIDFLEPRSISGIITQGRNKAPHWVSAYYIAYSQDGENFNKIMEGASPKIFSGNFDSDTPVTQYFPQIIRTRFLRVVPYRWKNWIALRLEVIGCFIPVNVTIIGVPPSEMSTTTTISPRKCLEPMGLENGQLPNSFISVTSSLNSSYGPSQVRLSTHSGPESTNGWVAAKEDKFPFIEIDFHDQRTVTGIITQGRKDADNWVTKYKVVYSLDGEVWNEVLEFSSMSTEFRGNTDRSTSVYQYFESEISARYLRIIPQDFHENVALRIEILGCFEPYDVCIEYGPWISLSEPNLSNFGDEEPIDKVIYASGTCTNPVKIQCKETITNLDYKQAGQKVTCDLTEGLICKNLEQLEGFCFNYEVRIGCWSCGYNTTLFSTTTTHLPLVPVCPEIPDILVNKCPNTCPHGQVCDGTACINSADCPCYHKGKKFKPGDTVETPDCKICECRLQGISVCKPITCPPCPKDQKKELDSHCKCNCVNCSSDTVLCPNSEQCIAKELWCDGIIDCPDDEVNCPPVITTTTLPEKECKHGLNNSRIATCEMNNNYFTTFDANEFQYFICNNVLFKDLNDEKFVVTVHKDCSPFNKYDCYRYIVIRVQDFAIKIGPGIEDVEINGFRVPPHTLWLFNNRFSTLQLTKLGQQIIFTDKQHNFDVIWDAWQNVKIKVTICLESMVYGLCGNFNNNLQDDLRKPDGNLASTSDEFGISWSLGLPDECEPPVCDEEKMAFAIETCELIREPFFQKCSILKLNNEIEGCILRICDCLQKNSSHSTCRCEALEKFVYSCTDATSEPLPNWRITYGCVPQCPPGLEWLECGSPCELTCDNFQNKSINCPEVCIPGCFCPSGLVRHQNQCVQPEKCHDCICRGHGDPNYITFDGQYYAFQGNCTYILAEHWSGKPNQDFQVLATNQECIEEKSTSCVRGLTINYGDNTVHIFKGEPVTFNDYQLKKIDFPFFAEGFNITSIPGSSATVYIAEINLVVNYFESNNGFAIKVPSFIYFNNTFGLCGICNFDKGDDLYHQGGFITEDVDDFAYSWLVNSTRNQCSLIPKILEPPPNPEICNFTANPCEYFLDPLLYIKSCKNDINYSNKPNASICRSKIQYAIQCCEQNISLHNWLLENGCAMDDCPENMEYKCGSACVRTCENYKTFDPNHCDLEPILTCTCPLNQVVDEGQCVDEDACSPERKFPCPTEIVPTCKPGEKVVKNITDHCTKYFCECDIKQCPSITIPTNQEPGEEYTFQIDGCCQKLVTECRPENCPPPKTCSDEFKLVMEKGKCCTFYTCVKKDICMYTHKYDIRNGTEYQLKPDEYFTKEYKPGSSWKDGLCRNCSCFGTSGYYAYNCLVELCPTLTDFTDNEDYFMEAVPVPDSCCAKFQRVYCISGGHNYSIGEEWSSPDGDKCKNMKCIEGPGKEPLKMEIRITCEKNCSANAVYEEPPHDSPKCCGHCQPIACEDGGAIYQIGEKWISEPCVESECVKHNDTIKIIYTSKECPSLPENCPKEDIIMDELGCCKICNYSGKCSPTEVSLQETVQIFRFTDSESGFCKNIQPVEGLLKCSGFCASDTIYSTLLDGFESACKCCTPVNSIKREIVLECERNTTIIKEYRQPVSCQCTSCSGEAQPPNIELPVPS